MSWRDWLRIASAPFRRGQNQGQGTRMNCKRGDLAIVIKGDSNIGRVVTIVAPAPRTELEIVFASRISDEGPFWRVDANLRWTGLYGHKLMPYAPDSHLRPIRPGEGEDEILRLVGKPVDHGVPA